MLPFASFHSLSVLSKNKPPVSKWSPSPELLVIGSFSVRSGDAVWVSVWFCLFKVGGWVGILEFCVRPFTDLCLGVFLVIRVSLHPITGNPPMCRNRQIWKANGSFSSSCPLSLEPVLGPNPFSFLYCDTNFNVIWQCSLFNQPQEITVKTISSFISTIPCSASDRP